MRHHEERPARAHPAQAVHDPRGVHAVERGRGLVREDHRGLMHDRPGDRRPLPLARRHLPGELVAARGDPELRQQPLRVAGALDADVLQRRQVVDQEMVLEDDPEAILLARLIFGEARGEPREGKIWVGGSVLNRRDANSWWPHSIKEVILQPEQYDPVKPKDPNHKFFVDPLQSGVPADLASWRECYQIAVDIISGELSNPTTATHFHGETSQFTTEEYLRKVVPKGKFLKKIGKTYFYWSPN